MESDICKITSKKLKKLIKQHQFLLSNAAELKKVLSAPMLAQFLASGFLICLSGYQITTNAAVNIGKCFMMIGYLSYNMFVFFLICRWSNEIRHQSEQIGNAVYFCEWEQFGFNATDNKWTTIRKSMLIVMLRSKRPVMIAAGGVYELSLSAFASLVKSSYSALTVLLRLRQE